MTKTVADEIDERGGSAAFARECGLSPGAVRQMKLRGHFPRSAWPEIQVAFDDLTLDRLLEIEAASSRGEAA